MNILTMLGGFVNILAIPGKAVNFAHSCAAWVHNLSGRINQFFEDKMREVIAQARLP